MRPLVDLDSLASELKAAGFVVEREDGYIVCEGWWLWIDGSVSKPAEWKPNESAWQVCDVIRQHIVQESICVVCGHSVVNGRCVRCTYPDDPVTPVELRSPCKNEDCEDGRVWTHSIREKSGEIKEFYKTCPECKGIDQ